jgi:hypothetical protein
MSRWEVGRRSRSTWRSKSSIRFLSVVIVPVSACEPSTIRNGAGSMSTLSMMRAAIRAGSPGASPLAGSSIARKLCAGVWSYSGMNSATCALL